MFWRSVNFILLIFSHIWPFIRGNKQQNQTKKSQKSDSKKELGFPQQKTLVTDFSEEVSSRRPSSDEILDESAGNERTEEEEGEEDEEQVEEEEMLDERAVEEFIQHPKDPEQNNLINVPSPLVLNQSLNAAGVFEENLDFTDPDLYWKLFVFIF